MNRIRSMRTMLAMALSLVMVSGAGIGAVVAQDPVELTVWTWSYATEKELHDQLNAQFMEQHPGIVVKEEALPSDYVEKMRAAIAARKGPDVINTFGGAWVAGLQRGFLPLGDRITEQQRAEIQHLDSFLSPDGNLYALPFTTYGYMLLYNKGLFEQAGLDPDAPPATWEELLDACGALRSAGIEPIGTGWKDGYGGDAWFWTGGTQTLDTAGRAEWQAADLSLESPPFAAGMNAMLDLQAADCFQSGADSRIYYYDVKDEFDAGKTAMILWPIGVGTTLKETEEALGTGAAGVAMPPPVPGAIYDSAMDSGPNGGFAITSWTPNADAAWEYLSFMTSKETQEFMWNENGSFPNNRASEVSADAGIFADALTLLRDEDNYPLFMSMPDPAMQPFRENVLALIAGDKSPEDIQKAMAPAYEQLQESWVE